MVLRKNFKVNRSQPGFSEFQCDVFKFDSSAKRQLCLIGDISRMGKRKSHLTQILTSIFCTFYYFEYSPYSYMHFAKIKLVISLFQRFQSMMRLFNSFFNYCITCLLRSLAPPGAWAMNDFLPPSRPVLG